MSQITNAAATNNSGHTVEYCLQWVAQEVRGVVMCGGYIPRLYEANKALVEAYAARPSTEKTKATIETCLREVAHEASAALLNKVTLPRGSRLVEASAALGRAMGYSGSKAKTQTVTFGNGDTAEIIARTSIRICGTRERVRYVGEPGAYKQEVYQQAFDRTFKLGETCERDSYNLAYTGKITSIGEKTVTIKDDCLDKTSRLTIAAFIERNWNFTLEAAQKRNNEWMD
jgi:hypothetical protein